MWLWPLYQLKLIRVFAVRMKNDWVRFGTIRTAN